MENVQQKWEMKWTVDNVMNVIIGSRSLNEISLDIITSTTMLIHLHPRIQTCWPRQCQTLSLSAANINIAAYNTRIDLTTTAGIMC